MASERDPRCIERLLDAFSGMRDIYGFLGPEYEVSRTLEDDLADLTSEEEISQIDFEELDQYQEDVYRLLADCGGRAWQKDFPDYIGISDVSVSRTLIEMEESEEHVISRTRIKRKNLVYLPGYGPEDIEFEPEYVRECFE